MLKPTDRDLFWQWQQQDGNLFEMRRDARFPYSMFLKKDWLGAVFQFDNNGNSLAFCKGKRAHGGRKGDALHSVIDILKAYIAGLHPLPRLSFNEASVKKPKCWRSWLKAVIAYLKRYNDRYRKLYSPPLRPTPRWNRLTRPRHERWHGDHDDTNDMGFYDCDEHW